VSSEATRFELNGNWKVFLNGESFPTFRGTVPQLVECRSADITYTAGEIQCTLQPGESVTVDNGKSFSAIGVTSVIISASGVSRA
jgi:hypothetical protein